MRFLNSNLSFSLVGLLFCFFLLSFDETRLTFPHHNNALNTNEIKRKIDNHIDNDIDNEEQHAGIHFAASHEEFEKMLRDAGIEDTHTNAVSSPKSDNLIRGTINQANNNHIQEHEEEEDNVERTKQTTEKTSIDAFATNTIMSTSSPSLSMEIKYLRIGRITNGHTPQDNMSTETRTRTTTRNFHTATAGTRTTVVPISDSLLLIVIIASFSIIFARKWNGIQNLHL